MVGRAVELLLRIAGWLLTPFVVVIAAGIGATIGLMVAPRLSPYGGLGATVGLGFVGAVVGLFCWIRLLRRSPELREVLAMTAEGAPKADVVEELIHHHPAADAAEHKPPR